MSMRSNAYSEYILDETVRESFPASDPPAFTGVHAGAPFRPISPGATATDRKTPRRPWFLRQELRPVLVRALASAVAFVGLVFLIGRRWSRRR